MCISDLVNHRSDKFVCLNCIRNINKYFRCRDLIRRDRECNYCNIVSNTIPVQALIDRLESHIAKNYEREECLDCDGNNVGEDLFDILDEILGEEDVCEALRRDIMDCFNVSDKYKINNSVENLDINNENEVWREIVFKSKMMNPYLALLEKKSNDHYKTDILNFASCFYGLCRRYNIIRELPEGAVYYRARNVDVSECKRRNLFNSQNIGAAPGKFVKHGTRMAPAGIGYFYASEDKQCAVEESQNHTDNTLSIIGKWKTSCKLIILDTVYFPNTGKMIKDMNFCSVFKKDEYYFNNILGYMKSFASDVSKSIDNDVHELEYRPTQMMCAYLMSKGVRGILYESSKIRGKINFCGFWDCDNQDKFIELVDSEIINCPICNSSLQSLKR